MKNSRRPKLKAGKLSLPAKESFELLRSLVDGAKEYGKTKEEETTKRTQIAADLKQDLARMKHQRDSFENALNTIFEERRSNLDKLFEVLDQALAADKDGVAIQALSSIEGIVKSSPLEPLLQTRQMLEDPRAVIEI